MASYVVYETTTGRIAKAVTCPESMIGAQVGEGQSYVEGVAPSGDFYVGLTDGLIKPLRDYSLSALPVPCMVTIEGAKYRCTSQPVFSFDMPGVYSIDVDPGPPYKRKVFKYAHPASGR